MTVSAQSDERSGPEGMGNGRRDYSWHDKLQTRLYLVSAIIMLVGLGAAAAVYVTAGDVPEVMPDFDIQGSKRSLRDLELYGGKANVLVAEFMVWFGGLWHGQSLASTIACITVVFSCGLFYVAHHWPSDQ